jgi:hypothetical protein
MLRHRQCHKGHQDEDDARRYQQDQRREQQDRVPAHRRQSIPGDSAKGVSAERDCQAQRRQVGTVAHPAAAADPDQRGPALGGGQAGL